MKTFYQRYNAIFTIALTFTSSCHRPVDEKSSSRFSENSPSNGGAFFGISVDTDGNVRTTFGQRERRTLDIQLREGGSQDHVTHSHSHERIVYDSKSEAYPIHNTVSAEERHRYLTYETAIEFKKKPQHLPTLKAGPRITVQSETYSSTTEAFTAFNHQMQALHDQAGLLVRSGRDQAGMLKDAVYLASQAHNADVHKTLSYLPNLITQTQELLQGFGTDASTSSGIKVRRAFSNMTKAAEEIGQRFEGSELARRHLLLQASSVFINLADRHYTMGDVSFADSAIEMAKTIADVAVGFIPLVGWGMDIYGAITGYNPILEREMTKTERGIAIFGAATAGIGSKFGLTVKVIGTLSDSPTAIYAARYAEDLLNAARQSLGKADKDTVHDENHRLHNFSILLHDALRRGPVEEVLGRDLVRATKRLKFRELWTTPQARPAVRTLLSEWQTQKADYPEFASALAYVEAAYTLVTVDDQGVDTKTLPNGQQAFFQKTSNRLVICDGLGYPVSMFKPVNGREYWRNL